MRMIETFSKGPFKITIFQTDQRYLLQAEDNAYILSWKVDKETPYDAVKREAIDKLYNEAENIWPELRKHLRIKGNEGNSIEDFPRII